MYDAIYYGTSVSLITRDAFIPWNFYRVLTVSYKLYKYDDCERGERENWIKVFHVINLLHQWQILSLESFEFTNFQSGELK